MTEMKTNQYALAGWLAIVSAVLLFPEIGLAALSEFVSTGFDILVIPIHIANAIIGVYILLRFRQLLNQEFDFHAADNLLTTLILINVVSSIVSLVSLSVGFLGIGVSGKDALSIVFVVLFVIYNFVTIAFGVVLIRMERDLFGMLYPFAYTSIGSGVCGATVILAPVGLLAAMAALVMQGMILLRAGREAEIL